MRTMRPSSTIRRERGELTCTKNASTQSGLCDLQTRCEVSTARRRVPKKCPNPKRTIRPPNAMRRVRGEPTRTILFLADYATSERDAKTARRADADYATFERGTKRARRADSDQKNLQPKADYSTSERDAKRARRDDADQKHASNQSF
jgi:hypothetical protein